MSDFLIHHPQFFTASILDYKPILMRDDFKNIITGSLAFLVNNKRVFVYAFVIMDNHIHLIWQARGSHQPKDIQRDFLKYTAQAFRFKMIDTNSSILNQFEVNKRDRKYQFWQRNSLSVDLFSEDFFNQKLDYIHDNPVKAGLCALPEEYRCSSASFYEQGESEHSFLTHHEGGNCW